MLDVIKTGHLTLHIPSTRTVISRGCEEDGLSAIITVHDENFFTRLVLSGDLGFAEGFMAGEVSVDDLTAFFTIYIANRDAIEALAPSNVVFSRLHGAFSQSAFAKLGVGCSQEAAKENQLASAQNAERESTDDKRKPSMNASEAFEPNNSVYESFLDSTLSFGSGIWSRGEKGDSEDLETAQLRKIQAMIDLADPQDGEEILELGCNGWGSVAIEIAKRCECRVVCVAPTEAHKQLTERRVRASGQADRITVVLCADASALPAEQYASRFDRIVLIETIQQQFGSAEQLERLLAACNNYLKPDGVMAMQCVTSPEHRAETYSRGSDFIAKHVFPGTYYPTVTSLLNSVERASAGNLTLERSENIGPHYARTLRVWRESFASNWDHLVQGRFDEDEGFCSDDTSSSPKYDAQYARRLTCYFAFLEAAFATRMLGNAQILLTKVNNMKLTISQGVPR